MWGSWVPVIAKFFFQKPLFIRVGYDLYKNSLIDEKNKLKLLFIFLISKLAYKSADHILLPTTEISYFAIKKYKLNPDKICIYPNWVDTSLFKKYILTKNYTNRVLFIGRLSKEKNIPLLINSLSKTNIGLDIIGEGDLKKNLQSEAKSLSIDVRFLGRIPNSELPKVINKYPIYILCSDYEGSPKTLLEAMSCEIAVIGTDQAGINNVITHDLNGILCDSSVKSLRESIIDLINNKNKRTRLGRAARKIIMNNNSKTSLIRLEMLIYKRFKNDL
jgi:glycosyltransferase involved in cell wall biosynthesis